MGKFASILFLNIFSILLVCLMMLEHIESKQLGIAALFILLANSIFNILYLIGRFFDAKKPPPAEPEKGPKGVFVSGHDVKEVHTVRRLE